MFKSHKSLKSIFWYATKRGKKSEEKVFLKLCNHLFVITRLHFPISRVPNHTRVLRKAKILKSKVNIS